MSGKSHPPLQQPASFTPGRFNRIKKIWGEMEIPVLIVLGLISIILGIVGFQQYYQIKGEPSNFGRDLYKAIGLFSLSSGDVALPVPWELEISRWLAPLVAMYAVLLGLVALFQTQFQMLRLGFTSGHVIICGLGKKSFLLAKTLKAKGQQVVLVERVGMNPYIPVCRGLGMPVIIGDGRDEFVLRKAGVKRASHLIILCGEDGTNAEIAMRARWLVTNRRKTELNCTVHIQDPHLWALLREHEFGADDLPAFRLEFFNIYAQGARLLLQDSPILNVTPDRKHAVPHLMIIGLGSLGDQLVIHAARLWARSYEETGSKLAITVVDPNAHARIETLCRDYSLVRMICDLDPQPIDPNSLDLYLAEFFKTQGGRDSISHAFICLEDETAGLRAALSLLESSQGRNVQILVRMAEDAGLASLLRGLKGMQAHPTNLKIFGLLERICKPDLLNDGSHESVARAIHEEYVRREKEKGVVPESNRSLRDWVVLDEDLKDMNRDQADQIGIKLNAIGCGVIPWKDHGADRFSFSREEIETLSRMEHERWCSEKIAQGWRYASVRDDRKKLHPSLIPWDDPALSELEKDKDRNTIIQIPQYLALAGFQIHRMTKGPEEMPPGE